MTAPLPTEVAVRRVVGTEMFSGGTLINGVITFTPQPREVIARISKTGITMQPVPVTVTNGQFTAALIAYDGATTDAGLGGAPWSFDVIRSWDPSHPLFIVVTKGPLGTAADPALDISDLFVPSAPANVAIVAGPAGPPGPASAAYDTDGVPYLLI